MKSKLLEYYLTEAIAKTRLQPHRQVSGLLADAMPEVCTELRRMVTAPDTDISTRKFAITILESLWRTLLTTAQSDTRTAVKREGVKVRVKRLKAVETQTALAIATERRRIDETLKKAEQELGG